MTTSPKSRLRSNVVKAVVAVQSLTVTTLLCLRVFAEYPVPWAWVLAPLWVPAFNALVALVGFIGIDAMADGVVYFKRKFLE